MADKLLGKQTMRLKSPPVITARATVVGHREGEGPLGEYFDHIIPDDLWGEDTCEKAERKMMEEAITRTMEASDLTPEQIDLFIAGDLLNQIVTSSFVARQVGQAFLGIYGACSSMTEGMALGSMLIDGDYADHVLVATSSHYQTAERQFRFPVELNIQRSGRAQFTVTGSGAAILSKQGKGPRITEVTLGKVIDLGLRNPEDLGSAMAPAAADTLLQHFNDTGRNVGYYDLIITGDLAAVGATMFADLVKEAGHTLGNKHIDAGTMIYGANPRFKAGGSGCGCSAVVFLGYIMKLLEQGRYRRVLFMATGALFSPLSYQQGESIPGVAHAVVVEAQ
ncbi:MAG: stage V sporulation protein AD [Limnochordia bacterium]|jgi:stage V sporulation protein AD|nr:stage V sporulation protein AD [Limnochordia bacterium]MDD2630590.1 stage V sporulation protein AD [Limnochordia bacterium]MDD4519053.1 stage V sporulation protein AD [Limnochordia bacterium]